MANMSASGKSCHVPARDDVVARSLFVFYLGLVVVFGLAGAWTKSPNPNEASFYLPSVNVGLPNFTLPRWPGQVSFTPP